jgi:hypothetical protein
MSRSNPPDPARTVHIVGDVHAGAIHADRLTIVQRDLAKATLPTPIARVQIGDATEYGNTTQDTTFFAWWRSLSAPLHVVAGNHDILPSRHGGGNRSGATWATAYGVSSPNYVVDLPGLRLIAIGQATYPASDAGEEMTYDNTALAYLDARLADADRDCWIVCHAPLYNTVLGDSSTMYLSTDPDFSAQVDADILAILASRSRAKAWISGHTHSPLEAADLLCTRSIGGRSVAMINASAIYYTGKSIDRHDPLCSLYLTQVAGGIEVRCRDHGAGAWTCVNGQRVTTLAVS